MMIHRIIILYISVLLMIPFAINSQPISFNITNLSNEFYPTDTIILEIRNSGNYEYVYKISLLSCIDNEWSTVVDNIFDEEKFVRQKHSMHIMRRININSLDKVEFLPMKQIIFDDIEGKYKFHLLYREYNKPEQLFLEIDSEKFLITGE